MTASGFDRVRPRTSAPDASASHDLEGKRALFSSTETTPPRPASPGSRGLAARPAGGGIDVDCSRCERTTTLNPLGALRLAFPAVHLGLGIRRGDREAMLGLFRRRYPSWLRCPACGHGSWVRVTLKV